MSSKVNRDDMSLGLGPNDFNTNYLSHAAPFDQVYLNNNPLHPAYEAPFEPALPAVLPYVGPAQQYLDVPNELSQWNRQTSSEYQQDTADFEAPYETALPSNLPYADPAQPYTDVPNEFHQWNGPTYNEDQQTTVNFETPYQIALPPYVSTQLYAVDASNDLLQWNGFNSIEDTQIAVNIEAPYGTTYPAHPPYVDSAQSYATNVPNDLPQWGDPHSTEDPQHAVNFEAPYETAPAAPFYIKSAQSYATNVPNDPLQWNDLNSPEDPQNAVDYDLPYDFPPNPAPMVTPASGMESPPGAYTQSHEVLPEECEAFHALMEGFAAERARRDQGEMSALGPAELLPRPRLPTCISISSHVHISPLPRASTSPSESFTNYTLSENSLEEPASTAAPTSMSPVAAPAGPSDAFNGDEAAQAEDSPEVANIQQLDPTYSPSGATETHEQTVIESAVPADSTPHKQAAKSLRFNAYFGPYVLCPIPECKHCHHGPRVDIHPAGRPAYCTICQMVLGGYEQAWNHAEKVHSKHNKSERCPFEGTSSDTHSTCNISKGAETALIRHFVEHMEGRLYCTPCKMWFDNKDFFRRHTTRSLSHMKKWCERFGCKTDFEQWRESDGLADSNSKQYGKFYNYFAEKRAVDQTMNDSLQQALAMHKPGVEQDVHFAKSWVEDNFSVTITKKSYTPAKASLKIARAGPSKRTRREKEPDDSRASQSGPSKRRRMR